MEEIKFCKNCIHCQPDHRGRFEYGSCTHPALVERNLVTGAWEGRFAYVERVHNCGLKAKYFEQKHERFEAQVEIPKAWWEFWKKAA